MDTEQKLREEYIKYWAYVMSSGIHGAELQRRLSDFWLQKRQEELSTLREAILNLKPYKNSDEDFANPLLKEGYREAKVDILALFPKTEENGGLQ